MPALQRSRICSNLIDEDKIIPDKSKSIHDGAIVPLGKYKNTFIFWQIEAICAMHGCTLKTPVAELPAEALDDILNGTDARLGSTTTRCR